MGWTYFIRLIKKNLKFIFLVMSFSIAVVSALSIWVIPKQYEAKISMMIVSDPIATGAPIVYDELQAGLELINDYRQIIETDVVLSETKERLSSEIPLIKNIPNDEMKQNIIFDSVGDSRVFNIIYRDTNNQTAQKVANMLAAVLKEKVALLLKVDNLSILGPAELPEKSVSPDLVKNIGITLILSLSGSIMIIVLSEVIKDEQ